MSDLTVPGQPVRPETARDGDEVRVRSSRPVMGPDGRLYELVVKGTAEVARGPLGQVLDLRSDLRAAGEWSGHGELDDLLDELAETVGGDPVGRLVGLRARLQAGGRWACPEVDGVLDRVAAPTTAPTIGD